MIIEVSHKAFAWLIAKRSLGKSILSSEERKIWGGFMEEEDPNGTSKDCWDVFRKRGILGRKDVKSKQRDTLYPSMISTQNSPETGIKVENDKFQAWEVSLSGLKRDSEIWDCWTGDSWG